MTRDENNHLPHAAIIIITINQDSMSSAFVLSSAPPSAPPPSAAWLSAASSSCSGYGRKGIRSFDQMSVTLCKVLPCGRTDRRGRAAQEVCDWMPLRGTVAAADGGPAAKRGGMQRQPGTPVYQGAGRVWTARSLSLLYL